MTIRKGTSITVTVTTVEKAPAVARRKMGYYATPEDGDRIRAAFIAARNAGGPWRSFSDFQVEAMLEKVAQLETKLNDGRLFEGAPAQSLSPGRPLE